MNILLLAITCFSGFSVQASEQKPWYEKISIKGYTQVRYNRLLETNAALKCDQCDKSWGSGGSFFMRRGRLIFSGDIHEQVFFYIQPDFATDSGTSQHYFQLRDAYFDLAVDSTKEFRFRVGQSKVPYGFENLQSSSNRAPLDRVDALNSGTPNERDLGVFIYWASPETRKKFKELQNPQLKGSGDYGVVGLGLYNGQSANKPELNNNRHIAAHITYPWTILSDQTVEAGVSGYSGIFSVNAGQEFTDQRMAAHFIWYPKPMGLSAEWTVGRGPMFRRDAGSIVQTENLQGGYVQVNGDFQIGNFRLAPYGRAQFFNGGKKYETNAPKYIVRELEIGTEWAPAPAFELTIAYVISSRVVDSSTLSALNDQKGNLMRLQAQVNY